LFQSSRLYNNLYISDPDLPALTQATYGVPILGAFGEGLVGGYSYILNQWATDKQTALFGQVDYSFTPTLKGTLGVRVAHLTLEYNRYEDGPLYTAAPVAQTGTAPTTNPVTPKIALSYTPDTHSLYYLSVSKGTREGGVNPPSIATGRPGCPIGVSAPSAYGSDYLWSYEIGAKNQLADGRLRTDASIYYIDWKKIQWQVNNNGCVSSSFVDNVASATVKGADLQAELRVTRNWSLFLAGNYLLGRFSSDTYGSPDTTGISPRIVSDGDSLGVPPWNVTLSSEYDFLVRDYKSYLRADYTYAGKDTGETPVRDPRNVTVYDPGQVADPAVRLLSARLGVRFRGVDISVFGRNLLNVTPPLGLTHFGVGDPLYFATTVTPRVLGITATYRY
jgi:iron complex outermembrane receptor protein